MKPLSRAFARLVLLFFALGIFFLAVNELIPGSAKIVKVSEDGK